MFTPVEAWLLVSLLNLVARMREKSAKEPYAIAFDGETYWDWGYEQAEFVCFTRQPLGIPDISNFDPLTCEDVDK